MLKFAEKIFRLYQVDESGVSEKDHLEALLKTAKNRGKKERIAELEKMLQIPDPPLLAVRAWQFFLQLDGYERSYAGFGEPLPLSAKDILPWSQLYKCYPTADELELIKALDELKLKLNAERKKKNGNGNKHN